MKIFFKVSLIFSGLFLVGACANAATNYAISSAVVLNNGSTFTLDNSIPTSYTATGDADLQSFTIGSGSGAVTYSTADFLSGVTISNAQTPTVGYIQRAGILTGNSDPKFTDGDPTSQFQTGSSDAASYLSHGIRGLSLSTGVNYLGPADPVSEATISFDATISNASALLDSTPDFLFGDVADLHSVDTFQLLDNSSNVIAEYIIPEAAWSKLGTHTVDRLNPVTTTNPNSSMAEDDTARGVALLAFSLEESDLTPYAIANFVDFQAAMDAVGKVQIIIGSAANENPKTDYAFFGINVNAIDSPNAVVPEISTSALLFGAVALGFACLRRRR